MEFFRCVLQVDAEDGQPLQQFQVYPGDLIVVFNGVAEERPSPFFEFEVAGAQRLRECIVGFQVTCLAQHVLLLALDLRERAVLAFHGLSLCRGTFSVDFGQLGGKQLATVRPEHTVAVELRDRFEQRLLPYVDRLGVSGELVRSSTVVGTRRALVVDAIVAVVNAAHAATAVAGHESTQEIGALGGGVAVEVVAVARALPTLASGGELVEHPLGDQRLVDGLSGPDPEPRVVVLAVP